MKKLGAKAKYLKNGNLKLTEDLIYYNPKFVGVYFKNNEFEIISGTITIYKGFEWNGCSFARDGKRDEFGLPASWMASCVHDCLYRYLHKLKNLKCKLIRIQCDSIFYDLLVSVNFKFLGIPACTLYYIGVRLGGGIALYLSRKFKLARGI